MSESALRELALCGELQREDMVWREGLNEWVRAYTVPGLFESPPPIVADAPLSFGYSSDPETVSATQIDDLASDKEPEESAATVEAEGATVTDVPHKQQHAERLKGVSGWLLLFCVGLTVLGPLFTLGQLATSWEEAKPAFDQYPSIETGMWLENLLIIGIVGYGFIIGIMLFRGEGNGKQLAERYLIIRLIAIVVGELLIVAIMSDLPPQIHSAVVAGVFGAIFREALLFAVWFSYFKKSKRVAATYSAAVQPQSTVEEPCEACIRLREAGLEGCYDHTKG